MRLAIVALAIALVLSGCAPPASTPTAAPPKPAAPTSAPAAKPPLSKAEGPAPTQAPAAKPAEKPKVDSKAEAKPAAKATEKPAAKTEAKPAAKAQFDEQAVADFYRGKTIRIIVGFAAGGVYDVSSRIVAKHLPKYLPGNPNVIVENRAGAASILAANSVYKSEPKDGTVIGSINANTVLLQALGADGIEYDAARFNWLVAEANTPTACAARLDSGIDTIQDLMNGKELVVGTIGPGTPPHDVPAVLNAALGTNFKLVPGYRGGSEIRLAVERKEVNGLCIIADGWKGSFGELLKEPNRIVKLLVVTGTAPPKEDVFQGVPAVEPLAKTEEGKHMLQAVSGPEQITRPLVFAPEVPRDRVAAARQALQQTLADPELKAEMQKAALDLEPRNGEEVEQVVKQVLNTPPQVVAKLKEILAP